VVRWRARFWARTQHELDCAWVEPHTELRLRTLDQLVRANARLGCASLLQECEDLGPHFVASAWTWSLWQQCRQAATRQSRLGRVEGWP
jgi:hypothetical protein